VPSNRTRRTRSAARACLALLTLAGPSHGQAVEWRIEGGTRDFAVTGSGDSYDVLSPGRVEIWSAATRTLLRTIESEVIGDLFGTALDTCDDLDGDGIGDLLVGALNRPAPTGGARGAVVVLSPATGQVH
jgi:FG-GAP repeat